MSGFRVWLKGFFICRRVARVGRKVAEAERVFALAERRLDKLKRRHNSLDARLWDLSGRVSDELKQMDVTRKVWEDALEEERRQREVLVENVLPLLTHENELARSRLERWIAMEQRGRAAALPGEVREQ